MIPTKDRPGLAANAVRLMLEQTRRPARIVLVDASERPLVIPAQLARQAVESGVELLLVRHPPSTSAQRNRGAREVETPIMMFLDDDVEVGPDYAEALMRRWERKGVDALGGVVGSADSEPESRLGRLFRWAFQLHMTNPRGRATKLRLSRKVSYVDRPASEVVIPVVGSGAVSFRTELVRRHPFNERFGGYALGEDLEMSTRLAQEAPILQVPDVCFGHPGPPGSQRLSERWYFRGRRETYFRLVHLRRAALPVVAFGLSLFGEALGATVDSVRDRDAAHVRGYVSGVARTLGEQRPLGPKPRVYQMAGREYRRALVRARRHGGPVEWEGIRIFGYHRIAANGDLLAVSPDRFRRQLECVLERGVSPLTLDQAIDRLATPLEGRFFCVTFEDGYRDVLENGVPILRDLAVPATCFVSTGVIDPGARLAPGKAPPVMSWDELRELDAEPLFDIQAQGRHRVALTKLPEQEARTEIAGCKTDLEARLQRPVSALCYPAGAYGEREVRLVRQAGFRAGVTCDPGVARPGVRLQALPRTMVSALDSGQDFEAKLSGLLDEPAGLGSWLRRRSQSAASNAR